MFSFKALLLCFVVNHQFLTIFEKEIDALFDPSRLVRNVDFACRDRDGSILAAFTDTDLRSAHVVARRLAGTLRQSIVSSDRDRRRSDASHQWGRTMDR